MNGFTERVFYTSHKDADGNMCYMPTGKHDYYIVQDFKLELFHVVNKNTKQISFTCKNIQTAKQKIKHNQLYK
jgi:hypothetical protein